MSWFCGCFSSSARLTRRTTNDTKFGPSTEELQRLTKLTYKQSECEQVLKILESRLNASDKHWRKKSKALTVLQYFVIHGSPATLAWMQAHRSLFTQLVKFKYLDYKNKDQGRSVREKSKSLLYVLADPKRIEETKNNYVEQKEGVRKSIGNGRPSTTSRNTLELIREHIFDDPDTTDLNSVFPEREENLPAVPVDDNNKMGLSAIAEEH